MSHDYYTIEVGVCLLSILIYLAIHGGEIKNFSEKRLAQVGFGFYPNGSVRLPERVVADAAAVIDDRFVPKFSDSAMLQLKSRVERGCILDFEREPTEWHDRLIQKLADRRIIALPERFAEKMPQALPIVSCPEPCNSWAQFAKATHARHPKGWMLEVIPWHRTKSGRASQSEGFLQNSVCRFRRTEKGILYYDTADTLRQKLSVAQTHGCRAAIVLHSDCPDL